jgi:hypothetical protein
VVTSVPATITVNAAFDAGQFLVSEGAVCEGMQPQAITGVSNATGGSNNYSYQWYKDGKSLGAGATAATYQPETFSSATTAVYTRMVTDGLCGTANTSGSFTLKVGGAATPTIDIVPVNTTVCNNKPVMLTAGNVAGAQTHKWESSSNGLNWTDLSVNNKDLSVSPQTTAGAYYYRVTVTTNDNAPCNVVTSVPSTVTVLPALSAGEFIVKTGSICVDAVPAAITGNVTDPTGGDGNYSYQWYKDGKSLGAGATAATYQPETFGSATTAVYTRGVRDGSCNTSSYLPATGNYTLTVGAAGTQTTNLTPAAQGICGSFDITAVAPENALGYTWEESDDGKTWKVVSGQNTNVLDITSGVTPGDYYYKVTILSAGTCAPVITSTPATVTVYNDFNPGSVSGSTATCMRDLPSTMPNVMDPSEGSGTFTYQWRKDGIDIPGATDATYKFTTNDVADAGAFTYTRMVTDVACNGSKPSAGSYILVVNTSEEVKVTPSTSMVCYGGSFTLEAALVNGAVTASACTWQSFVNGTWTDIQGATSSATLTIDPATATAQYRVLVGVQDESCPGISNAVTVDVGAQFTPGAITTAEKTICISGTPETIISKADAAGGLGDNTYQWYKNGTIEIDGVTEASYTPKDISIGTFVYTRKVTNVSCNIIEEPSQGSYTLRVVDRPKVEVKDANSCAGETVSLTAIVEGENSAATYNWQYYDGMQWIDVENNKPLNASYVKGGQTLTILGINAPGTYEYKVQMLTTLPGCETIESLEAQLTIAQMPKGGNVGVSVTGEICATQSVGLTLTGHQGTDIAWYGHNGNGNWSLVNGVTTDKIQVAPATAGTWSYMAVVKYPGCDTPASSTIGQVYVKDAGKGGQIDLTGDPYLCVGQSRTMKVIGADGTLQWQRSVNGGAFTDVSGVTGETLTSESGLGAGTYAYRVKALSSSCPEVPVYSDTVEIRIYAKSQGGAVLASNGVSSITMCYDGTADLKVVNYIGESFRWISRPVSGSTYSHLPGGNADTYTLSGQLGQGTYDIRAIVDAGCGPDTSAAMRVVVKAPIKLTLTVDGNSTAKELPDFCKGHELVLKVGGLDASATWTGTITTAGGATASTYSGAYWRVNTANVSAPGTYTYEVDYADAFCAPTHAGPITVDYADAPGAGTLMPEVVEFCAGEQGASETLTLSGTGPNAKITKWQYKDLSTSPGVGGWTTYPAAGTASMASIIKPNSGTSWVFRVEVEDSDFGDGACTTTYSNEAQVISYDVPTINEQSAIITRCAEVDVDTTFTVSAGATFQWEKTVDGGTPSGTYTGAINEHLVYGGLNKAPQTVTYTVTPVIGTRGCAGAPITLTYILWPAYEVELDKDNSVTELSCYGATEGKLVFTTSSQSAVTFTLSSSTGQVGLPQTGTAATFTGLGMGTYTLYVDNGICVTTIKDNVIEGPANPLVINNTTPTNAICYGGASGAITFEVDGGTSPYRASINNGAYVDGATSFLGLAAGMYSVKVQDAKGCMAVAPVTVGQDPKLTLDVMDITSVSAAGAHDATARLQATGGSGSGYSYSATGLDNDFSTNQVVKGLFEGTNYVYAKDPKGCMVSAPVEIGKYDGSTVTIRLTATVTKSLTCDAAADAEITVKAFGSSNYTYSRDGISFNGSNPLVGFGAGVHTITVKDGGGHVASIDVTVNPATPLSFTATITQQVLSLGGNEAEVTLNLTGDPATFAAFEYRMDNQPWGTDNVFKGLSAGTYAFNVRYNKSCEATPVVVGIPPFTSSTATPELGITASITRALTCDNTNNAEITVTALGGSGTYTYSLDGGNSYTTPATTVTVHVFDGLGVGMYNLRVFDNTFESVVIPLEITSPVGTPPVINMVASTATTCGNSNGIITIDATGESALVYSISGVQWSSNKTITNLSAGSYMVLAKDSRGCGASYTVTVPAIPPVTVEVTSVTPASALTAADGQVAITIAGGSPNYNVYLNGASTYSGYMTSATAHTFTGVEAGHYALTVEDGSLCEATKSVLVGAEDPGGVERISVSYTTIDPRCHDAANGQIIVTAQGGSGVYTYSLDDKNYEASSTFTGLPAGTYVVYVKDDATPAQKVYVSNIVLKGKEALSFTAAVVRNISSANASDAAILITAKGGTAPYQYSVDKGAPTASGYVDGKAAGTYEITVSDAEGCSVSGTIVIAPYETTPRPSISVRIIDEPACFGGNDGAIAVTASGGRSPYAYSVNGVNWTTNSTITGLAAGTYTVYVKELSLDRITDGPTVVLNNPDQLTASAVMIAAITAQGAADGQIRVDATGGTTPYQYSIDEQITYQRNSTFTGLQAQLYTFFVKDRKGCVATASIALAEPGKITVSAQLTKPISCGNDAEVTITASGGTAPYQYQLDNNNWSYNATFNGVTAGMHDVYVRDNVGNNASVQIFVPQPKMLTVTAQVTALPTGTNVNGGAIAITAQGGAGNYTYQVDGTSYPVSAVAGLMAGNHTIMVTDGNGCTATTSIRLALVDVIVSKTVINLQKGHVSETYTIRLTSAPTGNVTVQITDPNSQVTLTRSSVIFNAANWNTEEEVGVAIAPGVGSPVGGIMYFTTKLQNTVTNAPSDADYMGINREVIVNITDDGALNCTDFESIIPHIALNGELVPSPYSICTSDNNQYVLTTDRNGDGYKYRWLKNNFLQVSTAASYALDKDGTGTYTVIVTNASGCRVVSEALVIRMEAAPAVPIIVGDRVAREGQDLTYRLQTVESNVNYKWSLPAGYSLGVGSFDTDNHITMRIGANSGILRVLATRNGSMACAGMEGRLGIEVSASYGVAVFPTVASNGTPLKIMPKNMIITNIAVINAVGESYPYRLVSGNFPFRSAEEIQIMVNGLSSGHYFIVFYGQEQNANGHAGRSVKHTEHIVIKN